MIERWETPDFFEFDRVFKCPRPEFIYLIKGIAMDKNFRVTLKQDGQTKAYRLLTFRCSDKL
jgi:hypothetical protein